MEVILDSAHVKPAQIPRLTEFGELRPVCSEHVERPVGLRHGGPACD